jgi:hypothetical protein
MIKAESMSKRCKDHKLILSIIIKIWMKVKLLFRKLIIFMLLRKIIIIKYILNFLGDRDRFDESWNNHCNKVDFHKGI